MKGSYSLPAKQWYTVKSARHRIEYLTDTVLSTFYFLDYWKANKLKIGIYVDYDNFKKEFKFGNATLETNNFELSIDKEMNIVTPYFSISSIKTTKYCRRLKNEIKKEKDEKKRERLIKKYDLHKEIEKQKPFKIVLKGFFYLNPSKCTYLHSNMYSEFFPIQDIDLDFIELCILEYNGLYNCSVEVERFSLKPLKKDFLLLNFSSFLILEEDIINFLENGLVYYHDNIGTFVNSNDQELKKINVSKAINFIRWLLLTDHNIRTPKEARNAIERGILDAGTIVSGKTLQKWLESIL